MSPHDGPAETLQNDLLRAFAPLAGLRAPALQRLASESAMLEVPRGTVLFTPGQPAGGLPLLLSGRINVLRTTSEGKSILLYSVVAGETCVVSSGALLGRMACDATGIADSDARLLAVPRALAEELLESEPAFRSFIITMLGERLTDLMLLVEAVAFQKLDRRLAALLLERGPDLRITHQKLAEELGAAREMVSRVLRSFAERGWIVQEREAIHLKDLQALAQL